jgi:hypothetical protein
MIDRVYTQADGCSVLVRIFIVVTPIFEAISTRFCFRRLISAIITTFTHLLPNLPCPAIAASSALLVVLMTNFIFLDLRIRGLI